MNYLPATTYVAPPRQRQLKTIKESEECTFTLRSDSEGDESDKTIIARPAGLDARLANSSQLRRQVPVLSQPDVSPCSVHSSEDSFQPQALRASYASSDGGTVFSEDSCPSLIGSNDTTFYTNSSRNSVASDNSGKSGRNRYPSILIPRGSWQEENSIKEVALGMSPAQKLILSPQALSNLPQNVPALNAPPSLGDGSSIASNSPYNGTINSGPITPDLHNIVPAAGESWGHGTSDSLPINIPIEIAVDDDHSILVSPQETTTYRDSTGYTTDWSDMVVRFPTIPGATPQENTPIEPDLSDLRGFRVERPDTGVQLSSDAMNVLQTLTRSYSPISESRASNTTKGKAEMKERSDAGNPAKDAVPETPTLSDYSFSQLSIPSPGGFFSSLQANSRSTWILPSHSKPPSMPSSAVAENFYDIPFRRVSNTIETIMEVPDREHTDGPPTARQPGFGIPAEYQADIVEDDDLYGPPAPVPKSSPGFEYEASYEIELQQAAEAHIDRTSDWLSQQTSYLSALRESNPLNDPADYIPQTPHPSQEEDHFEFEKSRASKAVKFLEDATRATSTEIDKTPTRKETRRDNVFIQAFEHAIKQARKTDCFLQASPRLESLNSARISMPVQHVNNLLNMISAETMNLHIRPKYRGPYHQNPRATGQFSKTSAQIMFSEAERKQLATELIMPALWLTEAQRKVFYKGGYFACSHVAKRMSKQDRRNTRVLDLAGAGTASWAWSVACKYPNVRVVTVQTKAQRATKLSHNSTTSLEEKAATSNPANHKVVKVVELWKLPFSDNHFDVISARSLHMYLRSCPIPHAPSINEWDLTLKECLRVLKPGGILDFVVLDSHISNNSSENKSKHSRDNSHEASISPNAAMGQSFATPFGTATFQTSDSSQDPAPLNLGRELKKRGFEADGGCSKLSHRLTNAGFSTIRRQWIALPVGKTESSHYDVAASYENFEAAMASAAKAQASKNGVQRSKVGSISQANGRSRTPFPPAPRPISEVSSIGRIIEQYSNVEAVQGPVGSTADVSDIAGLVGSFMWEEWLVRHRLSTFNSRQGNDEHASPSYVAETLLHGINDILAKGYSKGACFRAVVGYARKPHPNDKPQKISINTAVDSYRARAVERAKANPAFDGCLSHMTPSTANTVPPSLHRAQPRRLSIKTPVDQLQRDLSVDTNGVSIGSHGSPYSYTQSAVERGEVGTIPMMIME